MHVSGPLWTGDEDQARVLLQTSGGGMLSGDVLELGVHCGETANARVGTVGATRLLPSEHACRQDVRLHLEAGSALTYLPEPLIPCTGAIFVQHTVIDVGVGATAIAGEVVTPGRQPLGESFSYRRLSFDQRVFREGRLVLQDRLLLEPAQGYLPVQMGSHTHFASVVLVGQRSTAAMAATMHEIMRAKCAFAGVTLAAEGVLSVKMLGASAFELQALMELISRHYLGLGPEANLVSPG